MWEEEGEMERRVLERAGAASGKRLHSGFAERAYTGCLWL